MAPILGRFAFARNGGRKELSYKPLFMV